MKKILFLCLFSVVFTASFGVNKLIDKPFVEGKGMKGWLIDSIRITDKNTLVYGHFGLGKGWTASGSADNYIEIPRTGKRYKQIELKGELPKSPDRITGTGQQVSFIYIFPPIPANTSVINITSDDFDGKGAAWYGVWLTRRTTIFGDKLAHLPTLEGNWFAMDGTGDWKAAFHEKKIFWNNRFWNFNLQNTTDSTATFELFDDQFKGILLKVSQPRTDELMIADNVRKYLFRKNATYSRNDFTSYATGYRKNDSITVMGWYQVANPVFSKQAALLVQDIFSDNPQKFPVKVSADGLFSVKIPLTHTARVTFSNELGPQSPLSQVSFMAEPGNKIIMTYRNEKEKEVVFGGDNQRVNNEFHAFSVLNPYFVSQKKIEEKIQSDIQNFAEWRKTELSKLKTAYFDWQLKNGLNKKLHDMIMYSAGYGYTADMVLASALSNNTQKINDLLPPTSDVNYYNNENALFSEDYFHFLSTFRALRKSASRLGLPERCVYLIKTATLTEPERNLLQKLADLPTQFKDKESYEQFNLIMKENKSQLENIFKANSDLLQQQMTDLAKAAEEKYKLPEGIASDYMEALPLAELLASGETTLTPAMVQMLKSQCKNDILRESILDKNEQVEKSIQALSSATLPDEVHVHEVSANTTELIRAISEKFKGKVIYLDFWATWCGPCRSEMPSSRKQKAELKGKDVAFVYLTGTTSPEMTWKRMIADIPGEHIRLTGEQWDAICKQFNVSGIPHYMLIDKKGNVVNQKAPRPSSGAELQNAIKKLL